jgi:hypothetical protein
VTTRTIDFHSRVQLSTLCFEGVGQVTALRIVKQEAGAAQAPAPAAAAGAAAQAPVAAAAAGAAAPAAAAAAGAAAAAAAAGEGGAAAGGPKELPSVDDEENGNATAQAIMLAKGPGLIDAHGNLDLRAGLEALDNLNEEPEEGRALDEALAQPDGPAVAASGPAAKPLFQRVNFMAAAAAAGAGGRAPPGPGSALVIADSEEEAGAPAPRRSKAPKAKKRGRPPGTKNGQGKRKKQAAQPAAAGAGKAKAPSEAEEEADDSSESG